MRNKQSRGGVQGITRIGISPVLVGVIVFLTSLISGCCQGTAPNPLLEHSEKAAMRELREISATAANLLNVYMDGRVTEMLVCSKLGGPLQDSLTVSDARVDSNRILREWLKTSGAYEAILLLDKNGVCLASAPAELVNQDLSGHEAFKGAIKGQVTIVDAHKSAILTTLDPKSKGWTAVIAVPMRADNQPAGVLMSCLKWSQLQALILGLRVGETGYVFVVNRNNQTIIHPSEHFYGVSLMDAGINRPELVEAIIKKAANQKYQFRNPRTGRAEAGLAGLAYPKEYGNFPGLGWIVGANVSGQDLMGLPWWMQLFR